MTWTITTMVLAAMLWLGAGLVAGASRAEAGGMRGRPLASQGHGKGSGNVVVVGPGSTVIVNQAPAVQPVPRPYVNPFYPVTQFKHNPHAPYRPFVVYPFAGAVYSAPTYTGVGAGYVDPGYSSVAVDQSPAYWVAGYWTQQWVPLYAAYQVWAPPHYDERGVFVEGRWENRTMETGGYYERIWVDGYWTR